MEISLFFLFTLSEVSVQPQCIRNKDACLHQAWCPAVDATEEATALQKLC